MKRNFNKIKDKEFSKIFFIIFLIPIITVEVILIYSIILNIDTDGILSSLIEIFVFNLLLIPGWGFCSFIFSLILNFFLSLKFTKMIICKFVYICLFLNILIFAFLRLSFIIEKFSNALLITILFLIPTFISILLIYLDKRKLLKHKTINLIQLFFIIPILLYFILIGIYSDYVMIKIGVSKPSNYSRVCFIYRETCKDFPTQISQKARNIKFHFFNYSYDEKNLLSLYYVTSEAEIDKYVKNYSEISKWEGYFSEMDNKYYIDNSFIEYTPLDISDINNFKLYYLDGYCNGYNNNICESNFSYRIVAINEETNEIIFFYK